MLADCDDSGESIQLGSKFFGLRGMDGLSGACGCDDDDRIICDTSTTPA